MRRFLSCLLVCASLSGCASLQPQDSLYDQMGGEAGLARLVETFLYQVADDDRINGRFADADIDRLQRLLNEQFCAITGGPCTYTGDPMPKVHQGMGITDAEFNALAEDMIRALDILDVPVPVQNRFLALLAPMHEEVVGL